MCGVGTILMEGKREWPNCTYYGGDIDPIQLDKALMNVKSSGIAPELFLWDCTSTCWFAFFLSFFVKVAKTLFSFVDLPFKNDSISAVISDIPFGKRHGSVQDNRKVTRILLKFAKSC